MHAWLCTHKFVWLKMLLNNIYRYRYEYELSLVSGTFEKFCLDKALPRSAKEVIKTHQLLTNASQNTTFCVSCPGFDPGLALFFFFQFSVQDFMSITVLVVHRWKRVRYNKYTHRKLEIEDWYMVGWAVWLTIYFPQESYPDYDNILSQRKLTKLCETQDPDILMSKEHQ